jgi:hypothetical protein
MEISLVLVLMEEEDEKVEKKTMMTNVIPFGFICRERSSESVC